MLSFKEALGRILRPNFSSAVEFVSKKITNTLDKKSGERTTPKDKFSASKEIALYAPILTCEQVFKTLKNNQIPIKDIYEASNFVNLLGCKDSKQKNILHLSLIYGRYQELIKNIKIHFSYIKILAQENDMDGNYPIEYAKNSEDFSGILEVLGCRQNFFSDSVINQHFFEASKNSYNYCKIIIENTHIIQKRTKDMYKYVQDSNYGMINLFLKLGYNPTKSVYENKDLLCVVSNSHFTDYTRTLIFNLLNNYNFSYDSFLNSFNTILSNYNSDIVNLFIYFYLDKYKIANKTLDENLSRNLLLSTNSNSDHVNLKEILQNKLYDNQSLQISLSSSLNNTYNKVYSESFNKLLKIHIELTNVSEYNASLVERTIALSVKASDMDIFCKRMGNQACI